MKKIINDPAQYTDDMLQGIYRAHGDQVGYVNGDLRCYCTKKKVPGKVAIITGGGTGHLPLFLGYVGENLLDGCAVCGAAEPEDPRFHLREGVLHCAACRAQVGDGISMPLDAPALAALRHIAYGDPKRLFSFTLPPASLRRLGDVTEAYLYTQLERGFRTIDYYRSLTKA